VIAGAACVALATAASASAAPFAYVTQGGPEGGLDNPHALAVYDVATGAKVRTINLPHEAFQIAIGPDGRRAYVATDGGLDVVDLASGAVVKTIPGLGGDVAVNPSGNRVYVTDETADTLAVVSTATNTAGTPIAVGDSPRAVVVNTAGKRAYTGNTGSPESVSVVNLTTNLETSQVTDASLNRPENLGISPAGNQVYIANFGMSAGGTKVSIFAPAGGPLTPVTVGSTPVGVRPNPSGTMVYVASRDSKSLSLINPATKNGAGSIPLGFGPLSLAITPDGRRAFVVFSQEAKWAIVNLVTRKIVKGPLPLAGAGEVAIPAAQQPVPSFVFQSRPAAAAFQGSGLPGTIARYRWRFGDGSTTTLTVPRVSHFYAKAGSYKVRLTETNTCDPKAIFGPLGVVFDGQGAYCRGARVKSKTQKVAVLKAAVAVVKTRTAKVGSDRVAKVKLACIRELPCSGDVVARWVPPNGQRVEAARKNFSAVPAGSTRTVSLKLSQAAFARLKSEGKLGVGITASTRNAGGKVVRTIRKLSLVPA
jgi:YVTN family beta-propeller protein